MHRNRFQLLGEFVFVDASGQPAGIALSKEIALVALLALSDNRCATRAKIIDLLWSDRCSEQGRSSLRHALWSLKKTLNRNSCELLRADRRRAGLDPDECSIDALDFETLALSDDQQELERAVSLYRGELLEDIVVNDREWEAWLETQRSRLQTLYAECLYRLCGHYRGKRDAGRLLATGLRLIAHDPLAGEGHRALMEAYAMTHRRSQALKQYRRYRDLVRRELDSMPEPGIRRCYEQIKGAPADDRPRVLRGASTVAGA